MVSGDSTLLLAHRLCAVAFLVMGLIAGLFAPAVQAESVGLNSQVTFLRLTDIGEHPDVTKFNRIDTGLRGNLFDRWSPLDNLPLDFEGSDTFVMLQLDFNLDPGETQELTLTASIDQLFSELFSIETLFCDKEDDKDQEKNKSKPDDAIETKIPSKCYLDNISINKPSIYTFNAIYVGHSDQRIKPKGNFTLSITSSYHSSFHHS